MSALIGSLDRVDRCCVEGWAHRPDDPGAAVRLELVVDGEVVATLSAALFRADLRDAGLGSGACAFNWQFDPPLDPGRVHIVAVRGEGDGVELPGSPQLIDRVESVEAVIARVAAAGAVDAEGLHAILSQHVARLLRDRAGEGDAVQSIGLHPTR